MLQYAGGRGPIHIYGVSCTGSENNLLECEHEKTEIKSHPLCVHLDDVGVSCGKSLTVVSRLYIVVLSQFHLAVKVEYDC